MTAEPLDDAQAPVKFDLQLLAEESADGLDLIWQCNRDLFLPASLQRLAQSQEMIAERLARRAEGPAAAAIDETTRTHIRNTDLQLGRLVDELGRGREEMTRELRGEIKLVARTIALAAGEPHAIRD